MDGMAMATSTLRTDEGTIEAIEMGTRDDEHTADISSPSE